jgi:DNA repair protein RecN (Recombination protein N)
VTHLPQIASLADEHLLVIKHQDQDRTWTEIKRLDGEGRVEELSRMLAGVAITDAARAHAREMLRLGAQASRNHQTPLETPAGKDAKPRRGARSRSLKE